jgi:hypothetical protein
MTRAAVARMDRSDEEAMGNDVCNDEGRLTNDDWSLDARRLSVNRHAAFAQISLTET